MAAFRASSPPFLRPITHTAQVSTVFQSHLPFSPSNQVYMMARSPSSHFNFSRKQCMIISAVVFLICIIYFCKALIAPPVTTTRREQVIPKSDLDTFAKHAINNTVVILPVNTGMLHWAANLICSLSAVSFDSSAIVFWALDDQTQDVLVRKGFSTYRDASHFSVGGNENKNGNTPDYQRMMRQRPKFPWTSYRAATTSL